MKSYKISLDSQCICPYPTSPINFGTEYAFSKIAIFGPVGGDFPVRAERVKGEVYPIVSFKKISNPGDRPGSLPSYRMSARALPGKTHCELEEIFRAKA